jgi:hypothetical protein
MLTLTFEIEFILKPKQTLLVSIQSKETERVSHLIVAKTAFTQIEISSIYIMLKYSQIIAKSSQANN